MMTKLGLVYSIYGRNNLYLHMTGYTGLVWVLPGWGGWLSCLPLVLHWEIWFLGILAAEWSWQKAIPKAVVHNLLHEVLNIIDLANPYLFINLLEKIMYSIVYHITSHHITSHREIWGGLCFRRQDSDAACWEPRYVAVGQICNLPILWFLYPQKRSNNNIFLTTWEAEVR